MFQIMDEFQKVKLLTEKEALELLNVAGYDKGNYIDFYTKNGLGTIILSKNVSTNKDRLRLSNTFDYHDDENDIQEYNIDMYDLADKNLLSLCCELIKYIIN